MHRLLQSGVFTVPISGIYEFTFHGISGIDGNLQTKNDIVSVSLLINNEATFVQTRTYLLEGKVQLAMSAIFMLNKNDEVACALDWGHLVNFEDFNTPNGHFTGQLLYSKQQNTTFPQII